jgi:glutathione S-transferase
MTQKQSPESLSSSGAEDEGGKQSHTPSTTIYHIALATDWEAARRAGEYCASTRGVTLEQAGFIHASTAAQVEGTRQRFYQDAGDLVLLEIDPARVQAEVRYEGGYPHIYGPLNLDAVVATTPMEARAG